MKNSLEFDSLDELHSCLRPIQDLLCLNDGVIESNIANSSEYFEGKLPSFFYGLSSKRKFTADYAIHEFSHCIEFSMSDVINRLDDGFISFSYTTVELLGQEYDEPTTCQGFEREIRTIAIQYFIINYFRKELNLSKNQVIGLITSSIDAICNFLNDSFLFKTNVDKMGGINIYDYEYNSRDKVFAKQVFKRVLLEMSKLDIDLIYQHKEKVKQHLSTLTYE